MPLDPSQASKRSLTGTLDLPTYITVIDGSLAAVTPLWIGPFVVVCCRCALVVASLTPPSWSIGRFSHTLYSRLARPHNVAPPTGNSPPVGTLPGLVVVPRELEPTFCNSTPTNRLDYKLPPPPSLLHR